jgi:hypothetical protein
MLSGLFPIFLNTNKGFSPCDKLKRFKCTIASPSDIKKLGKLIYPPLSVYPAGIMEMNPSQRIKVSSISNSVRKKLLNHFILTIFKLFKLPAPFYKI